MITEEKLIQMGGKLWECGEWVEDPNGTKKDSDGNTYSKKISKRRVYFDGGEILENAGIDDFGQNFYYDLIERVWGGELCGYEIDKMNEYYKGE